MHLLNFETITDNFSIVSKREWNNILSYLSTKITPYILPLIRAQIGNKQFVKNY